MSKYDSQKFVELPPSGRVLSKEERELDVFIRAYVEKFGYIPLGIGMPELTIELLKNAVETGVEIEEIELPEGAIS